jgi:alkylhydroperoxidase family enzyme
MAAITGRPVVEPRTGLPGCAARRPLMTSPLTFRFQKHIVLRMLLNSKRPVSVRIPPLEEPFPADAAAELAAMTPRGVPPIALFRTFARNVPMTSAMRGWGRYELSAALSLSMRQREIVIDRTCARCGCEYEWGVHVAFFAGRVDLSSAQVASLTHGGPTDDCWSDEVERILIELVDALHDQARVDDELWERAAVHLTDAQLLDVLLLCGWYHAISYVANGAGVELEPWAPRFADRGPS